MTTLTSIKSLRESDAMQSHVSKVETFLRHLNHDWNPEWWFPIALINVSNDNYDCSWVRSHTSTHLKPKTGDMIQIGESCAPAEEVVNALKGLTLRNSDDLHKINDMLFPAVFRTQPVWTAGMQLVAAPETQQPTATADVNTVPEQETNPVGRLITQLAGMETADIMAVFTAVNAARGGLLKGAKEAELTTFLHSVTGSAELIVKLPAGIAA